MATELRLSIKPSKWSLYNRCNDCWGHRLFPMSTLPFAATCKDITKSDTLRSRLTAESHASNLRAFLSTYRVIYSEYPTCNGCVFIKPDTVVTVYFLFQKLCTLSNTTHHGHDTRDQNEWHRNPKHLQVKTCSLRISHMEVVFEATEQCLNPLPLLTWSAIK